MGILAIGNKTTQSLKNRSPVHVAIIIVCKAEVTWGIFYGGEYAIEVYVELLLGCKFVHYLGKCWPI